MPSTREETREQSEPEKIVAQRYCRLLEAGYDLDSARYVAIATGIDIQKACDIVQNGCEPELALKILL